MSKTTRDMEREADRFKVLELQRGHQMDVVHAFNHSGGACPKCGCDRHQLFFCAPNDPKRRKPYLRECELEGDHLHRVCGACKYPWVELTLDLTREQRAKGQIAVETEFEAALCALLVRAGGAALTVEELLAAKGLLIVAERDAAGNMTLSTAPAPEQKGLPAHPSKEMLANDGGAA